MQVVVHFVWGECRQDRAIEMPEVPRKGDIISPCWMDEGSEDCVVEGRWRVEDVEWELHSDEALAYVFCEREVG